MSDTNELNNYNACLNIQVGPNGEITVGGKTFKLIKYGLNSIEIEAEQHESNKITGERIDKSGKKLKSITPERLEELKKAVERKFGSNKLKEEQSEKKQTNKEL